MSTPIVVLLVLLALVAFGFVLLWWRMERERSRAGSPAGTPVPTDLATGFVVNFFDALGIGCFAPTTAIFKLQNRMPDELIPGTLNAGHCLPAVAQAFIFTVAVVVDPLTLLSMIAAAAAGAWLGAGVVARLPRRAILCSLLGMNPLSAFPIMAGSCAFLMPVGGLRFIRSGRYHARAAIAMALGGVPAVFFAVYIVGSLPMTALRWLVMVVVLYAAYAMLRSRNVFAINAP